MSLLHQDSPEEIDVSARGEELTKGSSNLIIAGIVAAVVVTAAIALYFIVEQKPPAATGEIEQVWAHAQHTETSGFDANGAPMPKESYDQVYVFALIKLHNQSNQPLFLRNALVNATLADGIHSSYAATAADYDRVFVAYKDMPVPHGKALSLQATIDPGQTVEGTIVSAFRLDKQQWDARKDLSFTFGLQYQPNLVLAPHNAVIDQ
jgi:hypothetical protein